MKSAGAQRGFTLIELMVVIVIIGMLVAIALPNFIGAQERARLASVKANQHSFQTIVETYAIDWGGLYAADVATLQASATLPGRDFWQEFVNPFSGRSGPGGAYSDVGPVSITLLGVLNPSPSQAGLVLYDPVAGNPITIYFIYGLDKSGNTIRDKGQNYILSNS